MCSTCLAFITQKKYVSTPLGTDIKKWLYVINYQLNIAMCQ